MKHALKLKNKILFSDVPFSQKIKCLENPCFSPLAKLYVPNKRVYHGYICALMCVLRWIVWCLFTNIHMWMWMYMHLYLFVFIQKCNAYKHHWSENRIPIILQVSPCSLDQVDPVTNKILCSYEYKDLEGLSEVIYLLARRYFYVHIHLIQPL